MFGRNTIARALTMAAAVSMTTAVLAQSELKIMAPAAPGGGWDQTARSMQQALTASGLTKSVQVNNVGGAGGTVGLAQFVNGAKGDPNQLMVMGFVMVGAILNNKAPVSLDQTTPIARLTKQVGADPTKINYVPFSGGGEALAALLGGRVTAGLSGYGEFESQIKTGKLRAVAVTSAERIEGIDVPTLKEQGVDLDIENWRAVVGAPGITPEQRQTLVDTMDKMVKSSAWIDILKARGWSNAYLGGEAFGTFLKQETSRVEDVLKSVGMVK